ncbi:MAG: NAD(P)H-binding protein [Bryobacteraceae bacterium]|nr:NAD(P)H-binding protein [Bryobacteraceae bacterium]
MSKRLLIAGASGSVGLATLRAAKEAGYWVRTLSRRMTHYPMLARYANDVVLADATSTLAIQHIFEDVDIVISALGASVSAGASEKRSFRAVDLVANRNLLTLAQKTQRLQRFVYVSVHLSPGYTHTAYVQAHEDFVDTLQLAKVPHTIIRPTGVFSAFSEMLAYARYGFLPVVGDGQAKSNPIHEEDVARACLARLEGESCQIDVGGPDIYTRREMAELAFRALGREPRVWPVSPRVFGWMGRLSGIGSPRKRELFEFLGAVSTTTCVAPLYGERRLEDYFESLTNLRG